MKRSTTKEATRPEKSFSQWLEDESALRKHMTPEQAWQLIKDKFEADSFAEFSQLPGSRKKRSAPEFEL